MYFNDDNDLKKWENDLMIQLSKISFNELIPILSGVSQMFISRIKYHYRDVLRKEPPYLLSDTLKEMELRDVSPVFEYMASLKPTKSFWKQIKIFWKLIILSKKYMPFDELDDSNKISEEMSKEIQQNIKKKGWIYYFGFKNHKKE